MGNKGAQTAALTMAARRRRRQNEESSTDELEPELAAPTLPGGASADEDQEGSESMRMGSRAGSGPSLTPRTSTRAPPHERRHYDDHAPSGLAQYFATVRSLIFGSRDHYFLSRYQVAASTPLQMTLYFNIPYALVWAAMNQLLFAWKSAVWDLPLVVAVVSPMVFWVWAFVEPIRLLLGYVGNLRERVAWLGGFWVLTIFPQSMMRPGNRTSDHDCSASPPRHLTCAIRMNVELCSCRAHLLHCRSIEHRVVQSADRGGDLRDLSAAHTHPAAPQLRHHQASHCKGHG